MNTVDSFKPWYGRKSVRGVIFLVVLAAVGAVLYFGSSTDEEVAAEPAKPVVETTTASEFLGGESVSLVGNVRAFTEAAITTERAGRVVSVNARLGQQVAAGQTLATLENASERASIIQAEGSYDAALAALAQARAADAQSNVGVGESENALRNAQNGAINAYKSAYTTVNGAVLNNIDTFFTNPNSVTPGLRLDGFGDTSYLNSERVAYQTLLPEWQQAANGLTVNDDLTASLATAETNVERTITLVDTFIRLFNRQNNNDSRYTDAELQSFSTSFTALRSSLINAKSAVESAEIGLRNAKDAGARANITTSVSAVPAAEAQVKQALGSLRSAQANFSKTILSTPISGTVNSIDVKTGDFVNAFAQVGLVANNDALEIVTFVGDKDRALLAVGDEVMIEDEYIGRISDIAPAVDSQTRKTEVRIVAEDIDVQNGDTVIVSKEIEAASTSDVIVPLSAVKFELENGSVFVIEDGKLVPRAVTLGVVRGGSVVIEDGIGANEPFVTDARGLLPGTEVDVKE